MSPRNLLSAAVLGAVVLQAIRCPDCDSEVITPAPGVIDVYHDETCPAYGTPPRDEITVTFRRSDWRCHDPECAACRG